MEDSRWKKIQQIFEAALEKEPWQQESFLRDACGDDLELFEEVRSLLDADTNTHSLLQSPALDQINAGELFTRQGEQIGPYRILRQIGRGGMGAVYLAERADGQFEQQVALKLIKPGMDTEEILKRFHGERQILARLQHPNIARLLDGGITDRSLPYFTMEYVDGLPIDQYCDEHHLNIRQRLELFETVCAAVQYAHQNLVIHRDLKPNNIIITPDGDVKLLDFGIAAMLSGDQEGFAYTMMTEESRRVMTPEYASPEQTRGEAVTTASDVYSLGVVLYQLLTGRRPYRLTSRLPEEVEKIVVETLPKKPSTVITKSDETETGMVATKTISQFRKTTVDRLKRQLSGDLDNICLMALQKEPQNRYKSIEQLRQDMQRHIDGLPVLARPQTFLYYTQKFIRRHRTVLTIASMVLIVIIGLTIFYTSQLAKQRDLAQLEAQKAEQISDFLTSIFEVSDPYQAKGQSITARELLERGSDRIENELKDQPQVKATVMNVIGRVYYNMGLFDEADSMLRKSLSIRSHLYQVDPIDIAQSLTHLGELKRDEGNYSEADSLFKKALNIQKEKLREQHPDVATTLNNMGWLSHDMGELEQAELYYRESLEIMENQSLTDNPSYPTILNNLAQLLHETGRYETADSMFRISLDRQLQLHGEYHPEVSTTLYNYAQLKQTLGDYQQAESMYRRALDIDEKVFGDEHPAVAYTLSSLGRVIEFRQEYDEAEIFLNRALEIRRKTFGHSHPEVGFSLDHLGSLMDLKGNYDQAEAYFREALTIIKNFYGEQHPEILQVMHHIGMMYLKKGELKNAEHILKVVIDKRKRLYGTGHRLVANAEGTLANVLRAQGKYDAADSLLKKVLGMYLNLTGKEHPAAASILEDQASLYVDMNKFPRADSLLQKVLQIRQKVFPKNHPSIGLTYLGIGRLLNRAEKYTSAQSYLRKGLKILETNFSAENTEIAKAKTDLAECLIALQQYPEAQSLLQESQSSLGKHPSINTDDLIEVNHLLALIKKKL